MPATKNRMPKKLMTNKPKSHNIYAIRTKPYRSYSGETVIESFKRLRGRTVLATRRDHNGKRIYIYKNK